MQGLEGLFQVNILSFLVVLFALFVPTANADESVWRVCLCHA